MLAKIRKIFSRFVLKLISLVLVGAIAFWGIGARQSEEAYVAVVGKNNYIYSQDFNRAKQNFAHSISRDYPSVPLASMNVSQIVLDTLVRNKLYELETKNLGLYISDNVIAEQIKNDARFKDKSGNFSADLFKQTLHRSDISEETYVNNFKNSIATQTLASMIQEYQPAPLLIKQLHSYNNQKRLVEVMLINASSQSNFQATEQQIVDYYNKNKKRFTTSEYRDIEYIVIKPRQFMSEVVVSNKDVEEEMVGLSTGVPKSRKLDKNKIMQKLKEKKAAEVMYEKIKEIEDNLAAGDHLRDIVKKYNVEYITKPKLANSSDIGLNERFLQEAFNLSLNNPSDALQLDENEPTYYIINVQKVHAAFLKPQDEVKTEILAALQEQSKEMDLRDHASQVYNKFRSDPKRNLEHISRKILTLTRPDNSVDSGSNFLDSDAIVAAFNLKQPGDYTTLFTTKNGNFGFIILKEIQRTKSAINDVNYKALYGQLSEYMTSLMHQEFINYLYSQYPVKINEQLANS